VYVLVALDKCSSDSQAERKRKPNVGLCVKDWIYPSAEGSLPDSSPTRARTPGPGQAAGPGRAEVANGVTGPQILRGGGHFRALRCVDRPPLPRPRAWGWAGGGGVGCGVFRGTDRQSGGRGPMGTVSGMITHQQGGRADEVLGRGFQWLEVKKHRLRSERRTRMDGPCG